MELNLYILDYLINNNDGYIEGSVSGTKYDSEKVKGIGRFLLKNNGDVSLLSRKQKFYYEKFIEPLFYVKCDGIFGDDTCPNSATIDDEQNLFESYVDDEFLCQHCRYDKGKIFDE